MTINDTAQETTPAVSSPPVASPPKWFAALGLVAGLGAVVASSCCVIPLGLAALGAGAGVLGGLETSPHGACRFSRQRLGDCRRLGRVVAQASRGLRSGAGCASPERSRTTLALLLCASAIVLAAASWGYIDPVLLKLFRGR